MFRIYSNSISDDELIALAKLWRNMERDFTAKIIQSCDTDCKSCEYKHLCASLFRTGTHIDNLIEDRNLDRSLLEADNIAVQNDMTYLVSAKICTGTITTDKLSVTLEDIETDSN